MGAAGTKTFLWERDINVVHLIIHEGAHNKKRVGCKSVDVFVKRILCMWSAHFKASPLSPDTLSWSIRRDKSSHNATLVQFFMYLDSVKLHLVLIRTLAYQSFHEDGQFFGDDGELDERGADVRLLVVLVERRLSQFVQRPGQVHLVVHMSCNRHERRRLIGCSLEKRLTEKFLSLIWTRNSI